MPREPWRDDPEYVGIWRAAREQPDDPAARFVLSDWLEENGHSAEAWRERLQALTGHETPYDPDTGVARPGLIPLTDGAWRRLLAAPPADDLLCLFDRDVRAYQYLRRYRGRCGLDLGQSDWSSGTEREHLLAIPRLEMLACDVVGPDDWDWIMSHFPYLQYFEAKGPMIDAARLGELKWLTRLRGLLLYGRATMDTTAIDSLPGLTHLAIRPFWFSAKRLAALAPQVESLHADPGEIDETFTWPRLRSLQMLAAADGPLLGPKEVAVLARHEALERLNIRCAHLTATAIKALAGLPRLRELTLRAHDEQLPSLKALEKAPALESLTIEATLDADRLSEIVKLTGLRTLSLPFPPGGGKYLAGIARMRQLEEVRLTGEVENATALPKLGALPNLTKLDVQYLTMPPKTAAAVKAACPPWVECAVPAPPE